MKHDFHIKLKSNDDAVDRIELLAFTRFQAKKEVLRDIKNDAYWLNCNIVELYRNDGTFIKFYKIGE